MRTGSEAIIPTYKIGVEKMILNKTKKGWKGDWVFRKTAHAQI
jgi:hypothetical protein